jgi:hypothetical protein
MYVLMVGSLQGIDYAFDVIFALTFWSGSWVISSHSRESQHCGNWIRTSIAMLEGVVLI